MNPDTIAANLALVEGHFHSERTNEIETALELYTDDIVWEGPGPPTGRPAASSHLSAHLDDRIETGTFCVYRPDQTRPIAWDLD